VYADSFMFRSLARHDLRWSPAVSMCQCTFHRLAEPPVPWWAVNPELPLVTTRPVQLARRPGSARSIGDTRSDLSGYRQSTATSSAWQISRIRMPLSAPIRSTSTAVDTDSTESRLTAQRRPIGSSPGSRTTSLGRPLIVVVQGATSARRRRGIAASRDRTTTGRRPISGGSHHHSSPRTGKALTRLKQRFGTRRDRPTRLHRRSGGLRTLLHTWRRSRQTGSDREEPSVPRPRVRHRWFQRGVGEHHREACGRQSY